jgi:hypothetical protein
MVIKIKLKLNMRETSQEGSVGYLFLIGESVLSDGM